MFERRGARRLRAVRHRRGDAVILLYHRIADPDHDPWGNCVSRERFDDHLSTIAKRFRPVSLAQLASGIEQGSLPARGVCVTFDDGYRDNLYAAKPLLERYGVPATVFVVSGYVDSGREFWWDDLERICFEGQLPQRLSVEFPDGAFVWTGSADNARARSSWRAWQRPRTDRQKLFVALYTRMRAVDEEDRLDVLGQLRPLLSSDGGEILTSTADEITRLAESTLIEIGAHTVTHPVLRDLRPERQREEIVGARSALAQLLGRQIESFSYPNSNHDDETIAAVRDAGFARACSGGERPVTQSASLFAIPRVAAQNWTAGELEAHLEHRLPAAR